VCAFVGRRGGDGDVHTYMCTFLGIVLTHVSMSHDTHESNHSRQEL